MEDISMKNTKAELLQAYEAMRSEYETLKKQVTSPTAQTVKKKEEETILEKTRPLSSAGLEQDIANLKRKMSSNLDELLGQLLAESTVLQDVRHAIEIEKRYLQETRNIKLADDALQMLIAEFDQKQSEFQKKKQEQETAFTEEREQKEKERAREEEEFRYAQKLSRRNEEDKYQAEMMKRKNATEEEWKKREAELLKREEELAAKEREFSDLKTKVVTLTQEYGITLAREKEELATHLQKESAVEMKLQTQKWEGERNIFETKVANFERFVESQSQEIRSLKQSLSEANNRAQSLAATVIESVSGVKQMKTEGVTTKE